MEMHGQTDRLSLAFGALADPARRAILARLASGEADVSELMKPFALSQPTISKHLNVLERAGLVRRGRDAQRRPSTLVATFLPPCCTLPAIASKAFSFSEIAAT